MQPAEQPRPCGYCGAPTHTGGNFLGETCQQRGREEGHAQGQQEEEPRLDLRGDVSAVAVRHSRTSRVGQQDAGHCIKAQLMTFFGHLT